MRHTGSFGVLILHEEMLKWGLFYCREKQMREEEIKVSFSPSLSHTTHNKQTHTHTQKLCKKKFKFREADAGEIESNR